MQCKCGGTTSDHQVVRNKQPIAEFKRCNACGRISWNWGEDAYKTERKNNPDIIQLPTI